METQSADVPEATVRQNVKGCLEAPRLQNVSTGPFIEFEHIRKKYEEQVKEWNDHCSESIKPTLDRASNEDGDLEIFFVVKWIDENSFE